MKIIIDNKNKIPIYQQIYDSVRNAIIADDIHANAKLPSIRSLAKDLGVSVITTKRAYEDLEKDGYIYTVSGKGSYVTDQNREHLLENYLSEIEEHFKQIHTLAKHAGISKEELLKIFEKGDK